MSQLPLLDEASQDALEAFVQLVVLVAFADGTLSDKEAEVLTERVTLLSKGRVSKEWVLNQCTSLPNASKDSNNWRADLIDNIKGRITEKSMRISAFVVAMEVARADSGVGTREGVMLANLAVQLELTHDEIKDFLN